MSTEAGSAGADNAGANGAGPARSGRCPSAGRDRPLPCGVPVPPAS